MYHGDRSPIDAQIFLPDITAYEYAKGNKWDLYMINIIKLL